MYVVQSRPLFVVFDGSDKLDFQNIHTMFGITVQNVKLSIELSLI